MNYPINIPVDKKKTTRNFAASMLIVLLGLLFIIKPFWFIRSDDPAMIRTIGYLCIAFFGVISIFLTKTLLNKKKDCCLAKRALSINPVVLPPEKFYGKILKAYAQSW